MIHLKVDETAAPLRERLNLSVLIDENYVVKARAESTMRGDAAELEISNLEFALRAQESSKASDGSDNEVSKAQKVNSNTQLYKQAGNSITVDVIKKIIKNIYKK